MAFIGLIVLFHHISNIWLAGANIDNRRDNEMVKTEWIAIEQKVFVLKSWKIFVHSMKWTAYAIGYRTAEFTMRVQSFSIMKRTYLRAMTFM